MEEIKNNTRRIREMPINTAPKLVAQSPASQRREVKAAEVLSRILLSGHISVKTIGFLPCISAPVGGDCERWGVSVSLSGFS